MRKPNQDQIEYWNGHAGTQWVQDQTYLDALLDPLSGQALSNASAKPHERVLDVGCGCGTTSQLLAKQAAQVTGIDISSPMIEHARSRMHDADNIEFIVADASRWRGEAPYQLAFSRFGVMFFDDPVAAFSNLRKNLEPAGRLCFICWRAPQDNPWLSVAGAAAAPFLPEVQPSDGPNPFAFADTEFVSSLLTQAGFSQPSFTLAEANLNLGPGVEEAIEFLTRIGPLARVMNELEEPHRSSALDAVRNALQPSITDKGLLQGASAWIVQADCAT